MSGPQISLATLVGRHFHWLGRGWARVFDIDQCDECGSTIQAANGFQVAADRFELVRGGLHELETLPSEGYLVDDSGLVVCHSCYARICAAERAGAAA